MSPSAEIFPSQHEVVVTQGAVCVKASRCSSTVFVRPDGNLTEGAVAMSASAQVGNTPKIPHPIDSFAALFEESLTRQEMRIGEMITAEVVLVDQNIVVVNAGLKSESVIPVEEFKNDKGELEVKVGDFVTAAIDATQHG